MGFKFTLLSHNTILGAAGSGILNAELAYRLNLLPAWNALSAMKTFLMRYVHGWKSKSGGIKKKKKCMTKCGFKCSLSKRLIQTSISLPPISSTISPIRYDVPKFSSLTVFSYFPSLLSVQRQKLSHHAQIVHRFLRRWPPSVHLLGVRWAQVLLGPFLPFRGRVITQQWNRCLLSALRCVWNRELLQGLLFPLRKAPLWHPKQVIDLNNFHFEIDYKSPSPHLIAVMRRRGGGWEGMGAKCQYLIKISFFFFFLTRFREHILNPFFSKTFLCSSVCLISFYSVRLLVPFSCSYLGVLAYPVMLVFSQNRWDGLSAIASLIACTFSVYLIFAMSTHTTNLNPFKNSTWI